MSRLLIRRCDLSPDRFWHRQIVGAPISNDILPRGRDILMYLERFIPCNCLNEITRSVIVSLFCSVELFEFRLHLKYGFRRTRNVLNYFVLKLKYHVLGISDQERAHESRILTTVFVIIIYLYSVASFWWGNVYIIEFYKCVHCSGFIASISMNSNMTQPPTQNVCMD